MNRRWSAATVVIAALALIGLAYSLNQFLIPILVLGLIFVLYKMAPRKGQGTSYKTRSASRKPARPSASERRRKAKFRVIEGSKPSDPPEDPPRYH